MSKEVVDEMISYFKTAEWQTRRNLKTHEKLMFVAWLRAEDMCTRNYFSHQDPDGYWPNWHVRNAGYTLPDFYHNDSNQVESIAKGFLHVQDYERPDGIVESGALDGLSRSPSHHDHITGKGFWSDHTIFGVGYCDRYYVVITAPALPEPPPQDYYVFIPYAGKG